METRKMWKIHGYDSVYGLRTTANTNKFYETYEQALAAAERCFEPSRRNTPAEAIIIFEAVKIVRPARSPLIVEDIV